jgi:NADH-quinone oxidoreductase subunit M
MVAIMQTDYKRLLAYSSLSHMGFVLLGIFAALLTQTYGPVAMTGATLQMVNHGITTGALFLLMGAIYERRQTRDINQFGGLAEVMPHFNTLFWIALFASIGLPGLNGFVGEYLILQGTMDAGLWYAGLATTGVILGAVYMLRLCRSMMFGEITIEENRTLKDVTGREGLVLVALLALAVFIGVAPQPFLDIISPDARKVAQLGQPGSRRTVERVPVDTRKWVRLERP